MAVFTLTPLSSLSGSIAEGGSIEFTIIEGGFTGVGGAAIASELDIVPLIPGLDASNVQDGLSQIVSQSTLSKNTATVIGGHRVVCLESTGVKYASNDDLTLLGKAIGVTLGAAAANSEVLIKTSGEVTDSSWNWATLGPVFLGQNGLLTQVSPGPPALFSQIIGQAIAPTSIIVNIQSPIVLT
jgi:hypothetical protein